MEEKETRDVFQPCLSVQKIQLS